MAAMQRSRTRALPLVLASALLVSLGACSGGGDDTYPSEPITFIVPYGPGGSTDTISRTLIDLAHEQVGVTTTVLNRPGGSATVGMTEVMQADPDGYTIGYATDNGLLFQPMINDDVTWGSTDDYQPIIGLGAAAFMLEVADDAPWQTFEEFMTALKNDPESIQIAVSGELTPPDLIVAYLSSVAGVEISTVPYSGGGAEALAAVIGGHSPAIVETVSGTRQQIEAGNVRPLVTFTDDRLDVYPDVPTAAESGYDLSLPSQAVIYGPAGLPDEVVSTLYDDYSTAWHEDDFQTFLHDYGYLHGDEPSTADEVVSMLQETKQKYEVIQEALANR